MVLQQSLSAYPQRSLSVDVLRELIWSKCKGQTWKVAAAFDCGRYGSVGVHELQNGLKKLQIAARPSEVAELFSQLSQQRRTATVPVDEFIKPPKQSERQLQVRTKSPERAKSSRSPQSVLPQRYGSPVARSKSSASPCRGGSSRSQACRSASPNAAGKPLVKDASPVVSPSTHLQKQLGDLRAQQRRRAARAATEQASLRTFYQAHMDELSSKQRTTVECLQGSIKAAQEDEKQLNEAIKKGKQALKSVEQAQRRTEAQLSEHRFEAEALKASAVEVRRVAHRAVDRQMSADNASQDMELNIEMALQRFSQLSNQVAAVQAYAGLRISDGAKAARARDDEEAELCQERQRIRAEIEEERRWRHGTIQCIQNSACELEMELDAKFERDAQLCAKQQRMNHSLERRAEMAEVELHAARWGPDFESVQQELNAEQNECDALVDRVRFRADRVIAEQEVRQDVLRSEATSAVERGSFSVQLLREELEDRNWHLQGAKEHKAVLESKALSEFEERRELEAEIMQQTAERERHANRCCRLRKELAFIRRKLGLQRDQEGQSAVDDQEVEMRLVQLEKDLSKARERTAEISRLQLQSLNEGRVADLEDRLEALTRELNTALATDLADLPGDSDKESSGSSNAGSPRCQLHGSESLVQSQLRARVRDLQAELRNQAQEQHWAHISEVALGNDLRELEAQVQGRCKAVAKLEGKSGRTPPRRGQDGMAAKIDYNDHST